MPGTFGSGIKSIQRGEKTLTGATDTDTVTITGVVTAKAFVISSTRCDNDFLSRSLMRVVLTNTTTLTFTRGSNTNSSIMSLAVIELV